MQNIQTEVLVIGGGATGAGVLRDLAMRGFKAVLVERGDLTHGTTGRYHGLLHSGGRYVIKDSQAARECIQENRILRRIMPFCIEDTGGYFVVTPWDDLQYAQRFVAGCHSAGIPVEEIAVERMLEEEPVLNPAISRCFRVTDASADSFLATDANAASAREYGAVILNYHRVDELIRQGDRIMGARCHDLVGDEEVLISADLVVIAAGAWSGKISASVGIAIDIVPGKGAMLAVNHRILNTVVNRCRMPGDGDIIVPAHTVAVIGTTDTPVSDPDRISIEPWEVRLLIEEAEKLVPGLSGMRILRAWAGVRPLYKENKVEDTREVSRAFVLLDHEQRDGVSGLLTITGGKWTTYRKMAEETVDLVCAKLGVQRPCRTHLEPLPSPGERGYHYLGSRLARVEKEAAYGELICECELVTRDEVVHAITVGQAKTIDDIRRDVRLGMGPCQGGFCSYRTAGMLHRLRRPPVEETNVALRDFLQERWKGLVPILWGQQLRQERLDELIYLSILNADHLPGPRASRLASEPYAPPQDIAQNTIDPNRSSRSSLSPTTPAAGTATARPPNDALVIGAGLAGLVAAWRAAANGLRVRMIARGWGANHWHAGCIDVLGYLPGGRRVESPYEALQILAKKNPRHPYALAGIQAVEQSVESMKQLCSNAGYPLQGSLERNWLLPTSAGAIRPTCLAPQTMVAGDLGRSEPIVVVGFSRLLDFYPEWIADNLAAQGAVAEPVVLDLPTLSNLRFVYPSTIARSFETENFISELVRALKPKMKAGCRVGFPAVLGLNRTMEVLRTLEAGLDCEVFEIPGLPPSIPGIRLHNILVSAIQAAGGSVYDGMEAVRAETQDGRVSVVWSEAAARTKANRAALYVLATGGILGGGITTEATGTVKEIVFNLPFSAPPSPLDWFDREFLSQGGHPIFKTGLLVNPEFQPIDEEGQVVYNNLFAAGTNLGFADYLAERSFDGVALVTGYLVGESLLHHLGPVDPS